MTTLEEVATIKNRAIKKFEESGADQESAGMIKEKKRWVR